MTHADIAPGLHRALARIAQVEHLLVGLDFDGTLAPFHVDLHASRATRRSMAAVSTLVDRPATTVAFVSGRALESLREVAQAPQGVVLVGSHGLELELGDGTLTPVGLDASRRDALLVLEQRLRRIAEDAEGAVVEVKPTSVSLHTRGVSDTGHAEELEEAARAAAEGIPDVHVMEGKRIVELAVLLGDKGTALETLRSTFGVDSTFYAGDDTTDERAFAVLGTTDVGVHVGTGPTGAAFSVPDIPHLEDVLEVLAELR